MPLIGSVHLGHVLTIVGIVAVVNVINLIDGVDGLAAGVCVISAGDARGDRAVARPHRRRGARRAHRRRRARLPAPRLPAGLELHGRHGSNLLGYLLGAVAVQGALKTNAVVALFLPLIVLAVPILDTGFVIAKRIKYRQPIYHADRWHFHHRMANIGFSQRRTLAYLYGWALVMAGLALALRFVPYSDDHGNFDAALDGGDGRLPGRRARRQRLPGRRARDPEAAPLGAPASWPARAAARPRRTRSTRASRASSRPAASPAVDPETGEFEAIDPETGEFDAV